MPASSRYAVYYAPEPQSPLWRFGCETLGYDAVTGTDCPTWQPPDMTPQAWAAATEDPRSYGFHATLKAPFRLAEGRHESELLAFLAGFGRRHAAVRPVKCEIDVVAPSPNGGFVALTPAGPASDQPFAILERAVVEEFDVFRAPLTPGDIARRNPARLSSRQRTYLDHWGYPCVLEEFAFHMSLTGRLADPEPVAAALRQRAQAAGAAGPVTVDRLALFRQDPGERFRIVAVCALSG